MILPPPERKPSPHRVVVTTAFFCLRGGGQRHIVRSLGHPRAIEIIVFPGHLLLAPRLPVAQHLLAELAVPLPQALRVDGHVRHPPVVDARVLEEGDQRRVEYEPQQRPHPHAEGDGYREGDDDA